MQSEDEYLVMRSIAKIIGLTSHQLGKHLQDAGLRDSSGDPTNEARANGWIMPYRLDCGLTAYKWNREKVLLWWKNQASPKQQVAEKSDPHPV
jgi:hypothetical protein